MTDIIVPGERCCAVWRRLVSRVDPDVNLADRVLATRSEAHDGEVISEDALGNKVFRCTRYDTQMVEMPGPDGEPRKVPLCVYHMDLPDIWKAEREAAGDDGSAIRWVHKDRWVRGEPDL